MDSIDQPSLAIVSSWERARVRRAGLYQPTAKCIKDDAAKQPSPFQSQILQPFNPENPVRPC